MLTITIKSPEGTGDAELTEAQALALAQLVKRITWSEMRSNAVDDMRDAICKLQEALAGAGYAPR